MNTTRRMTGNHNPTLITAECVDIIYNPIQSQFNIQDTEILRLG